MRKRMSKWFAWIGMAVLLLPALTQAAGPPPANIVIVADTRKATGLLAWWADLYNESHLYFALLTVVLIPIIGVIFGTLADLVMSHIGIDLKSRELAEH
jgi:hypothetical protein